MLIFLLLITTFFIAFIHQSKTRKEIPKGPFPFLLLGNLPQICYHSWKNGGIVNGFKYFKKTYGKVFTLWIGPLPSVFIADYEVAYETHVKKANMFGARYAPGIMGYLRNGRGIVASNGEFWQEHRKFALSTFRNFGVGKNLMEQKIMEEFKFRISDFQTDANQNNGIIEVNAPYFFDLLIGSIINQILMSERFEKNDAEFKNLKTQISLSLENTSMFDMFFPPHFLDKKFLGKRLSGVCQPMDQVYEITKKNITRRIQEIANGTHQIQGEGTDFLDAFLVKIENEKKEGVDSSFSVETLIFDVYDLWLAGQETSSTTLCWGGICLLNHPEVQEKLRAELLMTTGGTRNISLTDKKSTPFLNATINEIQRIASILNINLLRKTEQDTLIDGQPIKAGTAVTTQLCLLHSDDELFEEPTIFNPERFLRNEGLEKKLIQFGIGKRVCIGESLARAELYLIIANLILNYKIEASGSLPSMETTSLFGIMKRPSNYDIKIIPLN